MIQADDDCVIDVRNAQLLAERIPGAWLESSSTAGHLVIWEEGESLRRWCASSCRHERRGQPHDRTVGRDRARVTPERVAIDDDGRLVTYRELDEGSDGLAAAFHQAGLRAAIGWRRSPGTRPST